MGIGKITIDHTVDLVALAEAAGQPDPEARWYDSGVLYVRGVTDKALSKAAGEINSPEAQAQWETEVRIEELKRELAALDIAAIRPIRAIQSGQKTEEDVEQLVSLEAEAKILRTNLQKLQRKYS